MYFCLYLVEPLSDNLKQIQSLVSLTLSDNAEMQRMAAFGFLRMSKKCWWSKYVCEVHVTILCIFLLTFHSEMLVVYVRMHVCMYVCMYV